jgi:GH25 family lysozyme M1 (1,4-beta-N-acetylmuramidase)
MQIRHPLRFTMTIALSLAVAAPAVVGALPSASAAKVYDGPDVSSYQHPHPTSAHPHGQPINWTAVKKAGKDFAIVKATEGTTYINPWFAGPYATDYADAAAAGLVTGSYHFARPGRPVMPNARAQAKFYAATIGAVNTANTLPPALDLEVTGGLKPGQLVTWAQAFLLEMRKLTGRTPMLYTYPSFWDYDLADPTALARYPLWMASYGVSTAPVADLWQYTSGAHINGIDGAVDESRFVGASGFPWATLSNGTVATPWKAAAPGAPVNVGASSNGNAVTVTWMPGDAGTKPVTGYTVTATPVPATSSSGSTTTSTITTTTTTTTTKTTTVTVGATTFSATLSGLAPGTSYTFSVTATNEVGTGTASAPTAAVIPAIPTKLATTMASSVLYGAQLPMTAKLSRTDTHAALAKQKVLVFRRGSTTGSWQQVRELSTDAKGTVATTLRPATSAQLEVVYPGANGMARAQSYTSYVVRPTVTATLSEATVTHPATVTLGGTVHPFVAGQTLERELYFSHAWHVRALTKVGPRGNYVFTVHERRPAVQRFRIVAMAMGNRGAGYSVPVTITVT